MNKKLKIPFYVFSGLLALARGNDYVLLKFLPVLHQNLSSVKILLFTKFVFMYVDINCKNVF